MDHSTFPITVHQAEDGTMYNSILSKSNADELAKQGELIITVVSGQYGDRSLKVILSHGDKFIRYAAIVVPCTAIRILFADILWPFLLW